MSFFIDTEPAAEAPAAEANGGNPPIGRPPRKRRQDESRILFRAVSSNALGQLGAAQASAEAGADADSEPKPKGKRGRFSRQAMNARFFDSGLVGDKSAGGFGQGRFSAGDVTDSLRAAVGIGRHSLPPWVYRMRVLGYPPGWLAEARDTGSGIAIIDDSASAAGRAPAPAKYDVSKLVKFPGFNWPLPPRARDEHRSLGFPPMRLEHHLSTFVQQLRDENRAQDADAYHTRRIRQARSRDNSAALDMELQSSVEEADLQQLEARRLELLRQLEDGDIEELDACGEGDDEDGEEESEEEEEENGEGDNGEGKDAESDAGGKAPQSPQDSRSLGSEFGSPVFAGYAAGLPKAANFNQNIEQFRPFENLPNATGSFEKVNAVVKKIRKWLPKIA